jgi:hypothetical protein
MISKTLGTLCAFGIAIVVPTKLGAAPLMGCYARTYDKVHLAQRPDQIVTAVKLRIYPSPSDPSSRWFAIWIRRRGEYKALRNEGFCKQDGPSTSCYIECDGGGVGHTPRSNSIISMRLGIQPPFGPNGEAIQQDERIRMTPCGTTDNDDGTGVEVIGGKDDHVFLLTRVDDQVCSGIER